MKSKNEKQRESNQMISDIETFMNVLDGELIKVEWCFLLS
jgi:DNA topoisomerase VI subunit A